MVMKKILLMFFLTIYLFSNYISTEVLLIEAKLYPKILYLFEENTRKEKIKVAIIVDNNNKTIGKKLKNLIHDKKIKIDIIHKINLNYDAYILTTKNISKKDIKLLLKNKKIIFTIYPNYVKNAMFSIYIGPRIYLYINPYLLKDAKLKFDPIILKVGKIYEK
jgi:hypothetical protein